MLEEERTYRIFEPGKGGSVPFRVKVETTDLFIRADRELYQEALESAKRARRIIADHGRERPEFLTSLSPLEAGRVQDALLLAMYSATAVAGVGPMAAVAGAVAQYVAEELGALSSNVLVENGGDLYLIGDREVAVGIFAGTSPFTGKLAIEIEGARLPLSVCTSSGTVGPSLSFGKADAATVVAKSAALADAVASGLGNRINTPDDLESALVWAYSVPGVEGVLAIMGDRMGCLGEIELGRI